MLDRTCIRWYTLRMKKSDLAKAAAALGRLGGLKGGKARAAKLSAEERKDIARNAALKRWEKKSDGSNRRGQFGSSKSA